MRFAVCCLMCQAKTFIIPNSFFQQSLGRQDAANSKPCFLIKQRRPLNKANLCSWEIWRGSVLSLSCLTFWKILVGLLDMHECRCGIVYSRSQMFISPHEAKNWKKKGIVWTRGVSPKEISPAAHHDPTCQERPARGEGTGTCKERDFFSPQSVYSAVIPASRRGRKKKKEMSKNKRGWERNDKL